MLLVICVRWCIFSCMELYYPWCQLHKLWRIKPQNTKWRVLDVVSVVRFYALCLFSNCIISLSNWSNQIKSVSVDTWKEHQCRNSARLTLLKWLFFMHNYWWEIHCDRVSGNKSSDPKGKPRALSALQH